MSRFYASIQGNRSERTCQGTESSGIRGHIRGWEVGVEVDGIVSDGRDTFHVYTTGGSNGRHGRRFAGTIMLGVNDKPYFIPAENLE